MLMIIFDDELGKDTSIKGKTIMECFITMKPKEVASNNNKNLKLMVHESGDVQIGPKG
jgi:hypothetical protein